MPDDDQPLTMEAETPRLPMLRSQAPAMSFDAMWQLAQSVAKSGLFGIKTADQALTLMSIAQAEGRHPALAARDYDIIQGRPAKKAEAMLRDFLSGGGHVEWHKLEDTTAEATFSHPAGGSVRIGWDVKRAEQAGLGGKDNWKKFPRQMLRSRVVSEGVRTVWPMATSGFYVPEEVAEFAQADEPPRQIDEPRPAGTKLDQFEVRHGASAHHLEETPPHDLDTGEVIDYSAGDAAANNGTEAFTTWWNSPEVKPLRAKVRGNLKHWQVLANAADLRGGPAPEEEDVSRETLGQSFGAAADEPLTHLCPALGNRVAAANVSDHPQSPAKAEAEKRQTELRDLIDAAQEPRDLEGIDGCEAWKTCIRKIAEAEGSAEVATNAMQTLRDRIEAQRQMLLGGTG